METIDEGSPIQSYDEILNMNQEAMKALHLSNYILSLQLLRKAEAGLKHLIQNTQEETVNEQNSALLGVIYNNFGCYYKKRKQINVALSYLNKALQIEGLTNKISTAETHINICAIYSKLNKHQKALQHAYQALSLISAVGNTQSNDRIKTKIIVFYNLGTENEFLRNYNDAKSYYDKGFKMAKIWFGNVHQLTRQWQKGLEGVTQKLQEWVEFKRSRSQHRMSARVSSHKIRLQQPRLSIRKIGSISPRSQKSGQLPMPRSLNNSITSNSRSFRKSSNKIVAKPRLLIERFNRLKIKQYQMSLAIGRSQSLVPRKFPNTTPSASVRIKLPKNNSAKKLLPLRKVLKTKSKKTGKCEAVRTSFSRSLNIRVQAAQKTIPPQISASNYWIIAAKSGEVLWGFNERYPRQIASLTKIMTWYLTLRKVIDFGVKLEDDVNIGQQSAGIIGTTSHLKAGDQLKLKDLLYGLMLPSGNDAADAIAQHWGGLTQFVQEMNTKAIKLKLRSTKFSNPHGLEDNRNKSWAYDIWRLASFAMKNKTFAKICKTRNYAIAIKNEDGTKRQIVWHNTNKLLDYGFQGIKTGQTRAAGNWLCSAFTNKNKMYIICILNSKSADFRFIDTMKLAEWVVECNNF